MKIISIRRFAATTLGVALATTAFAQNPVSDLTRLGDVIANSIQLKKPEWHFESLVPMRESEKVILQQWTFGDQSLRVALVPHNSPEDAARAMSDVARDGQSIEAVPDLADEGFAWGRGIVSFRKQNVTIHVSAVTTNVTRDPKVVAKNVKEERKLCKEFARLIADAIKGS